MAARSNPAPAPRPARRSPPASLCPLMGALGGALSGFALTGEPIGACVGRTGLFLGRLATTSTTTGERP